MSLPGGHPASIAAIRSTRALIAAGSGRERGGQPAAVRVAQQRHLAGRQFVERLRVGPQLAGRAGERLRHPRAERRLQGRERLVPDPGPGVGGVGVVRVVPGPQAEGVARNPQGGPPHAEQRPPVVAAGGRHPGQRPGARAAGQAEQDRFRLVVQAVAEQDGAGAGAPGHLVQRLVAGAARRGLRAARTGPGHDRHRHGLHRVKAESGQDRRDAAGSFG